MIVPLLHVLRIYNNDILSGVEFKRTCKIVFFTPQVSYLKCRYVYSVQHPQIVGGLLLLQMLLKLLWLLTVSCKWSLLSRLPTFFFLVPHCILHTQLYKRTLIFRHKGTLLCRLLGFSLFSYCSFLASSTHAVVKVSNW